MVVTPAALWGAEILEAVRHLRDYGATCPLPAALISGRAAGVTAASRNWRAFFLEPIVCGKKATSGLIRSTMLAIRILLDQGGGPARVRGADSIR
jgi:hypothetical protein